MENSIKTDSELLVGYYEEFESNTINARKKSETSRDYYNNKQWTDEEIQTLEDRKQPVVTFNLVKRTINALIGLEEQNKTDPKGLPRTPLHEDDAHSVTDSLRYVVDNNDFDSIALEGFENLLIEGAEGADINIKEKGDKLEVTIDFIDWDRMWWDIHSRRRDYSDCKVKGIVIWMDWDDAKERFGESNKLSATMNQKDNLDDTHSDRPAHKWNDAKRKRVKICFANYKKGGVWHWAYFTQGGIIQGGKPSPFLDEDGNPEDQLEFQSVFIDRDGNRMGYTEELLSPQDEVNKRRQKGLHLISQRQTFGNGGIDARQVKEELAKPDGHVEMNHGEFGKDFGIIPTSDMAQGNFAMLEDAKEAFNVVGANTSVTGQEDRVRSGRAEQFRQLAGARELVPVLFSHKQFKRRIYRKAWNRIRQYWDKERWIRVTDDEKNLKWVAVNRPVTLGQQIEEEFGEIPPEFQGDPRLQEVVEVKNQLAEIDVDIMIEETPDIANIQQEQFELVVSLAERYQDVPIEAIVELSTLRNKDQFIEKIKGNQEAQQAAAEKAEQAEDVMLQEKVADIGKTRSETVKNEALAGKAQAEMEQIDREPLAI